MNFLINSWTTDSHRRNHSLEKAAKCQHHLFISQEMFSFSLIYIFFNLYVLFVSCMYFLLQEWIYFYILPWDNFLIRFHVKNLIHNWTQCRNFHLFWSFMNIFLGRWLQASFLSLSDGGYFVDCTCCIYAFWVRLSWVNV